MLVEGLIGFKEDKSRTIEIPTHIFALRKLKVTKAELNCLRAVMQAEEENMPTTGAAMRYRIELAAVTLAMVINQSYNAAEAGQMEDPDVFSDVMIEHVIERAKEIWSEGPQRSAR